jgi:16S rRNA (adenine1518-N6/adenine1519-N6)-dimethyltransferase
VNRQELIKVLAEYGIQPSKAKGQNFLVDRNMLEAMVKSMNLQKDELVLEVGPGTGVLTRIMIEAGCKLTSVETDKKLFKYLTENVINPNFNLVYGDACRVDYSEIIDPIKPFRCIANLPYAISSVFISKMLEQPNPPKEMYFLLQKEMAERFSASVDTKKYGSLTVRAGVMYNSKILRKVPPGVFYPPPKIDSSFIQMTLREDMPSKEIIECVNKLARVAFSQRRKKAHKLLCGAFPSDQINEIYKELSLDENLRAENLSVEQYIQFAKLICKK